MSEISFCPEKSRIQSCLCWRYMVLLPCRKDNANTHPEWIHLVRIFIKISFLHIITFYCWPTRLWECNVFSCVCLFAGGSVLVGPLQICLNLFPREISPGPTHSTRRIQMGAPETRLLPGIQIISFSCSFRPKLCKIIG